MKHTIYITYVSSEKEVATSAGCEVPCWQQQLECEGTTKPQNCEADAQSIQLSQLASDNVLAQPSALFCWVIKNQISNTTFSIFKSMPIW